jgi:hypothetical protein
MAFCKSAFIQSVKGSTHTGMSRRSSRLDDDGNLIVVTVTEPVEGHSSPPSNLALARPCLFQRFDGELTKRLVPPLGSCLDILDDDACPLLRRRPFRHT